MGSIAALFIMANERTSLRDQAVILNEQNRRLMETNQLLQAKVDQLRQDNVEKSQNLKLQVRQNQKREEAVARMEELDRSRRALAARIQAISKNLQLGLLTEMSADSFAIEHTEESITIRFPNKALFREGDATIQKEEQQALLIVADVLNQEAPDAKVLVEGHTDSSPIGPALRSQYPTNWDLSAARATAAVRTLEMEGKVDSGRLSAVGRGSTAPLVQGNTPEAQNANRRIELVLKFSADENIASRETASTQPSS